jgi:hypothetical protein
LLREVTLSAPGVTLAAPGVTLAVPDVTLAVLSVTPNAHGVTLAAALGAAGVTPAYPGRDGYCET